MRPVWKGSISFGLVNIPIGVYAATKPANEIKFRLLRDSDSSPVRYKRIAQADDKEVEWNHIVKGYETAKDDFVVLTKNDFDEVALKSKHTVEIQEFVDLEQIEPTFFDKPYYLVPEKGGARAYALLRDALIKSSKVGIAKVVFSTREHLAAVKPQGNLLVMEIMHFADELIDPQDFQIPPADVSKKELGMAEMLIASMAGKWEPEKYSDEYRSALMEVIERKLKAGDGNGRAQKAKHPLPGNVVDIVDVLRKSLAVNAKKKSPPREPAKRLKAG